MRTILLIVHFFSIVAVRDRAGDCKIGIRDSAERFGRGCSGGLLTLHLEAVYADRSPVAETIALSTTEAVLENTLGQFVSNLTINPGATVQIKAVGPVTATPSADSRLAVTAKHDEGPPCNLPSPQNYRAVDAKPTDAPEANSHLSAQASQDEHLAMSDLNQNRQTASRTKK